MLVACKVASLFLAYDRSSFSRRSQLLRKAQAISLEHRTMAPRNEISLSISGDMDLNYDLAIASSPACHLRD